ncbi:TonB-dependent receptor [Sphingomonas sp.]|uniref:TonB-dependent receptor n=1 Tax=Sphingomonas sp. TaxID=28214 RepID=UPI002ED921CA
MLIPVLMAASIDDARAQRTRPKPPPPANMPKDIIVTARRVPGSAVGSIAPIAIIDQEMIRTLAPTSMRDLLTRLTALSSSAGGGSPVLLLNGRRLADPAEVQNLPPEAIERAEILSEQDAARFGFPPTVKVMNFITKKRFRGTTVVQVVGTTTEGGGETNYVEANATRIDGPRRTSLAVSHLRLNPILQSERAIVPDPDTLPAGVNGADIGRYRSLQQRTDTVRVDGTMATPVGKTVTASLNLSMEAQRNAGLNGLLATPDGGTLADRALRQRSTNLTLRASNTVQGSIRRWAWSVTNSYDQVRNAASSQQGIAPPGALDVGAEDATIRSTSRSLTRTGTLVSKAVANGPVVRLPAGDAQVTVTADYARSTSVGSQPGLVDSRLDLTRTIAGASVNADLPIASPTGALSFIGGLSANGMIGVSDVSRYGRLVSSNYGLAWAPVTPIQFTASVTSTQTPPAIASLAAPILTSPNTPFFDFTTGATVSVTTLTGGNPGLAPERRRATAIGINVKPFKAREFRVNLNYVDTDIVNQAAYLGSLTQPFQAAFPGQFVRDANGRLAQVDLRPVSLANERERLLRLTVNLFTPLGPAPPPPPAAPAGDAAKAARAAKDAPPPPPPKQRPTLFGLVNATLRLDDRLTLRPGLPALDLLDGATLTGTGGRPRWEADGNLSLAIGAINLSMYGRVQGPTRVRSEIAASDLRFSGRIWLVPYMQMDIERVVRRPWTRKLSMAFVIENLLNDRIDVRDRTGAVPNRFQPAYLDPYGRSIRASLRKVF